MYRRITKGTIVTVDKFDHDKQRSAEGHFVVELVDCLGDSYCYGVRPVGSTGAYYLWAHSEHVHEHRYTALTKLKYV